MDLRLFFLLTTLATLSGASLTSNLKELLQVRLEFNRMSSLNTPGARCDTEMEYSKSKLDPKLAQALVSTDEEFVWNTLEELKLFTEAFGGGRLCNSSKTLACNGGSEICECSTDQKGFKLIWDRHQGTCKWTSGSNCLAYDARVRGIEVDCIPAAKCVTKEEENECTFAMAIKEGFRKKAKLTKEDEGDLCYCKGGDNDPEALQDNGQRSLTPGLSISYLIFLSVPFYILRN